MSENFWDDTYIDSLIEKKIAEEAYYNYLHGYKDSDLNWEFAKHDVYDRIRFLAFYQHESNINRSADENWNIAKKIYAENF